MTIDEMKKSKTELGLTAEMIAERSGVALSTVHKVFGGFTQTPRKSTMESIEKVLLQEEARKKTLAEEYAFLGTKVPTTAEFRERAFYEMEKREGGFTIEDYYAKSKEKRVELIDGKIYDMAAPTQEHQRILTRLAHQFMECTENHDMPCEVLVAPCDVRLDKDRYTMVQPDLLIICNQTPEDKINPRIEGAPDLVVEILSPSTRSMDMVYKLFKYKDAGVREYWIVDPENRKVFVHYFEDPLYYQRNYEYDDQIPVGISEGKCEIDFGRVTKGRGE